LAAAAAAVWVGEAVRAAHRAGSREGLPVASQVKHPPVDQEEHLPGVEVTQEEQRRAGERRVDSRTRRGRLASGISEGLCSFLSLLVGLGTTRFNANNEGHDQQTGEGWDIAQAAIEIPNRVDEQDGIDYGWDMAQMALRDMAYRVRVYCWQSLYHIESRLD
jgi:hypothetical protein